ncbi:hypothetical protein GH714_006617 [Hevea brasiliensis]|uniref:DUF3444 domain-containing protein n=1 Tax=Hevea brasiliensis TaxID=3981 RepID=A0A6A6MZ45_HEVBR|nr:hypothetical protein GH714_006617 [Hevea brasiliensis]
MGAGGEVSDLSGSKKGSFERERVNGITQPCGTRYVFQFGNETLLMEKARAEIYQKLNEWNSATVTKSTIKNEKINVKENDGGEKSQAKTEMCGQNKSAEPLCTDNVMRGIKCSSGCSGAKADIETLATMSIDVPDPDFYNFDKDRTENCFGENQVWAAYDVDDGMPRYYAMKGDVWALYRNWSPEWNEITEDKVVHKYDMVEVLEDYSEELGVTVAPLVKVVGFKTLFHQHLDPGEIRCIPKKEMFRFSHLIPSYLLTGQEGPNAPKGCLELDPAATPLELHQVIVDAKDVEILDNEETSKKEKR